MSFIKIHALAITFAAGLSQVVALSQSPLPRTESSLSRNPALVEDWARRLLANDPKVRATAEAALVQGGARSFALLRRLLDDEDATLHVAAFSVIQRIGPPAIPLLVRLLQHESDSIRRGAVSELIDLAPYTESIQPALRLVLRDADSIVAGDAARALGALGSKASPSVDALVTTLPHEDPYVRIYAAEALASIGPSAARATKALTDALGDPIPRGRRSPRDPLDRHPAGAHLVEPKDRSQQLRPAGADEPGDAEHLSPTQVQVGPPREPTARQPAQVEHRLARLVRHAGEHLRQVAADHRRDDRA